MISDRPTAPTEVLDPPPSDAPAEASSSPATPSRAAARRARRRRTWRRRGGVVVLAVGVALMGLGITMLVAQRTPTDPVDVQGEIEERDPSTVSVLDAPRNTLERDSVDDPVVDPADPGAGEPGTDDPGAGDPGLGEVNLDPGQIDPAPPTTEVVGVIDENSPPVSVL